MDKLLTQLMQARATAVDEDLQKRLDLRCRDLMGAELAATELLKEIRSAGDRNLETEWETAKANCRSQLKKVERAEQNAAFARDGSRAAESTLRSTQIALRDFEPLYDRWASAEEIEAHQQERAVLERAVADAEIAVAQANKHQAEQRALHVWEVEELKKRSAIEEELGIRLQRLDNPDQLEWDRLGLQTNGKPFGSSLPLTHPS